MKKIKKSKNRKYRYLSVENFFFDDAPAQPAGSAGKKRKGKAAHRKHATEAAYFAKAYRLPPGNRAPPWRIIHADEFPAKIIWSPPKKV